MPAVIASQQYGKDRVRLVKVAPLPPDPKAPGLAKHIVRELTVRVLLEGDFDPSYTKADNSMVVPTDTVKNTIYILAKRTAYPDLDPIELFAREIIVHFLSTYPHVHGVDVHIQSHDWTRIQTTTLTPVSSTHPGTVPGGVLTPHPHSFYRAGDQKRFAHVHGRHIRDDPCTFRSPSMTITYDIHSGITDLYILKTTGSSFTNFHKDAYTTLPEMSDRIFSTTVDCTYTFDTQTEHIPLPTTSSSAESSFSATPLPPPPPTSPLLTIPFSSIFSSITQTTLDIFSNHSSPSVQNTLYRMGQVVLGRFECVKGVKYVLPNRHVFGVDLERFGVENSQVGEAGRVLYPVADPSGYITATMMRGGNEKAKAKL
ncbi:hypothetical protein HK104_006449 [Borealophlyctis nickersoniae]|nr:hypothetical protein HK104_006449 [Borealophlyctis nickersoniae]